MYKRQNKRGEGVEVRTRVDLFQEGVHMGVLGTRTSTCVCSSRRPVLTIVDQQQHYPFVHLSPYSHSGPLRSSDTAPLPRSPRAYLHVVRVVVVYVKDIHQPRLPTPFYSVLVSVSVFMALSTLFHSINSPDNSPLFFWYYFCLIGTFNYISLSKVKSLPQA